ncbi:MAG: type II toxin-antitoxin system death-on-curing family toxin [Patescibacteria group bacterium]
MKQLTAEDILVLHAMVIDATGGSNGVRDPHLLASIAEKPFASFGRKDLYATVWMKAAILFEGLVNYHVFLDRNKPTGFIASARFLHLYGFTLTSSNSDAVQTAVAIATKELSIEALAAWLEANAEPS